MVRSNFVRRSSIMSIYAACMLGISALLMPSVAAYPIQPNYNHFLYTNHDDFLYDDNASSDGTAAVAAQQAYDNRAYPHKYIDSTQESNAYDANLSLAQHPLPTGESARVAQRNWQLVGPLNPQEAGEATYTGRPTTVSGRVTAIAVANDCNATTCRVWLGAAGGGIWRTNNGLADKPSWESVNGGIRSNAIGSITIDPTDHSGHTLYAGTGEENGSSDSEAGVGLYKSTDYGQHWALVPGSIPAAKDRSIGSVAVDPTDSKHIYIGTAVARHGSSSSNGGRFSPPDAPRIGLYESHDGGKSFTLVFSKESDIVNPGTPNGSDFFRGGISKISFNTTGLAAGTKSQIYFSVFDYGLYRTANGSFEQVFASAGGGTVANSIASRTEFALAPMGTKLRIYLGDTGAGPADFYRIDDGSVAAATLTDGTTNPGWIKLSNPTPGTPGYASYNYCSGQCSYDMPVASPIGQPDSVWIGGQFQYGEITPTGAPSNGRTVQRSTDAGASFTDMTNDTKSLPQGMHPDQHAIAFDPNNPNIAFLGSDGGLVRTGGTFTDTSAQCATRGISDPANLADCQMWLKAVPTQLFSLNEGLGTIQFQSLAVNPQDPKHDLIGGTQDNGTFNTTADPKTWIQNVGGDGGQSLIDVNQTNIRMHTYFGPQGDVNFSGNAPLGWDFWGDPLSASKEAASFYVPLIGDPKISQTMFVGLEHVWRTQDSGGQQAYLDKHCNEFTGDFDPSAPCGDWVPLGKNLVDQTYGTDKTGSYVVAITRASSDTQTMWTATRRGRLFISLNANAAAADVAYTRLDTAAQPTRFISGIAVDPNDKYHAYVSYSGYSAYTPSTPGHVFEVRYNPATGNATWKDISYDLGDQPITSVAYDQASGDLYAATDFGVGRLKAGHNHWRPAAPGLPIAAVYGLTISDSGHVLYAATHGRSAWKLDL